ncbi:hypothetical protein K493DRAFT_317861 [Basidiobolus meristosporus CBS 931.73]|uniref:Peptide-O-fucosyltransferase n=1 Tax=Basidiobolus meristosporus CBS 931.73 TaxID=1314790 RepID=A0A1Y1XY43_9FUNG|nr:hypothetical protein K493DRAFT_317861 [Basidiobolus meristosporus CBS 931.73]|eukprot:ORX90575.1 hypothetical protein K493DRAFT_317861 [Basidiobolus meristosporus CBS 931.73]
MDNRKFTLFVLFVFVWFVFTILPHQWNGKEDQVSLSSPVEQNYSPASLLPQLNETSPDSERFITYLTHSTFHNQRAALENAIILARVLNRSLLVPSAYMGVPYNWEPFDKLYQLEHKTKKGKEYCSTALVENMPPECSSYTTWTRVPWSYFYDFSPLDGYVTLYEESEVSFPAADITYIKDSSKLDYKLVDNVEKAGVGKFERLISIDELKKDSSKLIHFGSLFLAGRIQLFDPELQKAGNFIRSQFITYKNPVIAQISDQIIEKLGGARNYASIHLRSADNTFHKNLDRNVQIAVESLKARLSQSPTSNERQQETIQYTPPNAIPLRKNKPPTIGQCLDAAKRGQHIVFLATDSINPRFNGALRPIFREFPCTFVIRDFAEYLSALSGETNRIDGVRIGPHMIPMVETLIAARAHEFVGTNESTFSSYIEHIQKSGL